MGRPTIAVCLLGITTSACAPSEAPVTSSSPNGALAVGSSAVVREALPAASRAAVEASPIPVLTFPDPAWAPDTVATSGLHFAAVSCRRGGHTMSVHATDVATEVTPGEVAPARADRVRGRPATMLVNEGIRSLAWEEAEVSYVLEIECEDPEHDPFCTTEPPIRGLAESLVRVGGGR